MPPTRASSIPIGCKILPTLRSTKPDDPSTEIHRIPEVMVVADETSTTMARPELSTLRLSAESAMKILPLATAICDQDSVEKSDV